MGSSKVMLPRGSSYRGGGSTAAIFTIHRILLHRVSAEAMVCGLGGGGFGSCLPHFRAQAGCGSPSKPVVGSYSSLLEIGCGHMSCFGQ